ncbi:MAG: nucleotidyl transferase AbiEii/AbiGii toxin family protein [Paludibacteraceae bacterium]|nr:nucleotidyl transferase AbiEii/AbiGii toxin family protein [Paludibacteraceae bacterium]
MRLHENKQLFADAIDAASRSKREGGLGIKSIFIEKDYWICRSLKRMSESDVDGRVVFKGGTSLSKAYGIGARFSEDIDIAIAEAWTLSGNQLKNLIRHTAKNMTDGLKEIVLPGVTSKGSRYHKAFYAYPRVVATEQVGAIKTGQLLVEINSFANPYPSRKCLLSSFLTDFIIQSDNESLIEEYEMQPFEVTVLDKRRTLIEKLVSLLRCSLADNPMPELSAKIRHFYDLHFLLHDSETYTYLQGEEFKADLKALFLHDQQEFEKPEGWQDKRMSNSALLIDFHEVWNNLRSLYMRELSDLAYQEIPTSTEIEESLNAILSAIK